MRARCALPSGAARATTNPLSAQLARRSQACESNGVSGALEPGGAIIMPPFMRGSSPFRIVIVVSLGGVLPAAAWAEEPPCPNRSGQPGTLAAASGGVAASAGAPRAPAPSGGGGIDLSSDRASFGADGKATLEGKVLVRQGERESGFLFPAIGNTSYGGLQLAVTYYWNIAPNADFTFQPVEYSRAGADLGGDLRFLTHSQRGEIDWNYLPYDGSFHGSRNRVRLTEVAELADDLRLTANAENVSDPFYFENFSLGPEGTSTAFVERRAALTYRGTHWRIDGEAQQFQTIDYTLPVSERPYARVPRIAVSADYGLGAAGLVRYGFDSEVVDFQRPAGAIGVTGWRADLRPTVSLDLTGPGYFVRPALAWRATGYQLEHASPGQPRSPSRKLPVASFDTGLLFERESGSHAKRKLTLEPRILYLEVPYRNQDQLPVFDTALPDLNPVELFRTNRYVGADRVSDANQVSAGITSRLLDARDGRQFLAATIGQTYYFVTPRVTLPGEIPATGKRSDFVAQLALTAFRHWSADVAVQWDPQTQASERAQANLQYKSANNAVLNLAYRYERSIPLLDTVESGFEQVEASGAWPIRRSWNLFAREVYSLRDHEPLERFAGFEYRACCWRVRLGARRYVSSHVPGAGQDTGVWLQLELAGLASVGSASDASLTEVIRGYAPAEATAFKNQGPLSGVW